MAAKKNKPKKSGVRGPSMPQQRVSRPSSPAHPSPAPRDYVRSPRRAAFERWSFPYMARLTALPRWLLIIAIGSSLLLGLVLSGSFGWLGAIFLLVLAAFLGWLLALSWPLLSGGRRFMRLLVVAALIGLAYLKITGQL
ncbi:MAG: hypothetical protein K9G69_07655 [Candidatus Nanopelagicales bacterium]|nr:hypothetical protein [Candidatus Nanopelagicales bacterium]